MEQTGQASPVQTPHHEVSKRTATLIVVLFAFTIFGAAALLAHPAGQELLGVRVESMSSKASVSDSETQYDCIAAPCGTEETKDEPVINCIKAPCPGGELAIVTTELPAATAGMAYSHQLEVSGGSAPYKWSINNTAMSGIEIKPTTGEVFGAPKVGTHKITVKVIDAAGVAVSRLFVGV